MSTKLCDTILERQYWANERYSMRECLEISDVRKSVTDNDLEEKVMKLLEKIDVEVHHDHIKACHWIKSNAGLNIVNIKMSRRKDADKIQKKKKKLESLDLSSIGINSGVFINDSLCRYCKDLWAKCKKTMVEQIYSWFFDFQWVHKIKTY